MNKKILILGASRYYIKCIEAAKKAGFYVYVIDKNPKSPGFDYADEFEICDIIFIEGIRKIVKKNAIFAVVPINDYGVMTAAIINSELPTANYIDFETAKKCTSKRLMREQWIKDGVNCPEVFHAESIKAIYQGVEKIGYPCILKPAEGLGGASRGVVVIHDKSELEEAIEISHSYYEDKSTLIETFIEAKYEHSVEVLIKNGEIYICNIGDNIKLPLPYRVNKSIIYPTIIEGLELRRLKKEVTKAIHSLGIKNGVAHVEVATTKDKCILFELGARCGGGGIPTPITPFVSGVSEFVEFINIIINNETGSLISLSSNKACLYHWITPAVGKVKSISGIEDIVNDNNVLDFELLVSPGDTILEVKSGIERSGFIIVGGKTRDGVLNRGLELENSIKIEYF